MNVADFWSHAGVWNVVTIVLAGAFALSVAQGLRRGASSSAKHLALMMTEGAVTLASLLLAWQLSSWLSPQVQSWLIERNLKIPPEELGMWEQFYYTGITAMRDFSLLRYSVLFVLGYGLIKQLVYRLLDPAVDRWLGRHADTASAAGTASRDARGRSGPSIWSSLLGGVIGALTGLGRGLVMVALLFIFTTLFPQTPLSGYIQASTLYQTGAKSVIKPVTGGFLESQLPVFTRAVEQEFSNILQRKYEVLDSKIPDDIAQAAKQVTAKAKNDEEKARMLYRWVGTRIQYDWDKVEQYEKRRIWKEQTPEDTFATKQGVCIDFSRLYAVMARSVGLDVKVVTGLGYDGQGGYGPHAWNEVYLADQALWVPLDSTWVASGGNWFNPPGFNETHIKDA
ncbi:MULTISPECIES: transglutaminase domain-containing protein [unclassified Paenibacillus]|uniref:transglutaminase domain-containing protein n=1 Tax=unclassified Paenibacillus TaxID=185978 RepID=UPI000930029C|nr:MULTISPECIES: transglutaminase domain-containing protein [unclassified Paenibacillus]